MNDKLKVIYREARNIISEALKYEENNQGKNPECLKLYKEGSSLLNHTLQNISSPSSHNNNIVVNQMRDLLSKVDERICVLEKIHSKTEDYLSKIDHNHGEIILNEVMQSGLTTRFSDIIGQHSAKEALRESVILPSLRPDIFTGLRSPNKGILLLGAPGNGKTLLAEACAVESGCRFFNISSSSLTSKWVGESEKLMRSLFVVARELQPSIIFFDEVDSLLNSRTQGEHDMSRRLKTEFLARFGGAGSSHDDSILVIGATNRPQDIDEAVLRRFPKRILVDMPDTGERKEMISHFISKVYHVMSPEDFDYLAEYTKGFSGSDLFNLAKDAAYQPIREVPHDKLSSIDKDKIRAIDMHDFILCLEDTKPSVKSNTVKALKKWLNAK